MIYSAMYINENGELPWIRDCDEATMQGNAQKIIDRIYDHKQKLSRDTFKSTVKNPRSKNLIDIVKDLEKLEFEEDPHYDEIVKSLENIERDYDDEKRKKQETEREQEN